MGPKIEAVCRFVEATGKMAAIGQLGDAEALLRGDAGTVVTGLSMARGGGGGGGGGGGDGGRCPRAPAPPFSSLPAPGSDGLRLWVWLAIPGSGGPRRGTGNRATYGD